MKPSREAYRYEGYVIARQVVPRALLANLTNILPEVRRQVEAIREVGPADEDRLQPVHNRAGIDRSIFTRLWSAPSVRAVFNHILSRGHIVGRHTGVLLEPANGVDAIAWHRDGLGLNMPNFDQKRYYRRIRRMSLLSQVCAPLLPDRSFWIVPGSVMHPNDKVQRRVIERSRTMFEDEATAISLHSALAVAREMPGAVNLYLSPGDLLLYRAGSLHMSIRSADEPRATIIDRPQCLSDIIEEARLVDFVRRSQACKREFE